MDTPETLHLQYAKRQDLRYGENPHQRAALYVEDGDTSGGIATAEVLHGKPMSFLNYVDADAAWQAVWDIATPACVVVKHASPCGAATRIDLVEAYLLALGGDPLSAYGGIVAVNRPVDAELATAVRDLRNPLTGQRQRWDVFVAPDLSEEGLAILRAKSKDLRVLRAGPPSPRTLQIRPISGGVLVQEPDGFDELEFQFDPVTHRLPTPAEVRDLAFAWRMCKHVASNAITLVRDDVLVGVGTGQPSRVGSVTLAVQAAGERVVGSVLASDAAFPFPDGIERAAAAGVTAVVHPGGSIRDDKVIDAANRFGLAMVVTGRRHFRH
jgi:phosphoribosylaminoimidazolecarboxamide formyltransferase/IMP cyclohydrolase